MTKYYEAYDERYKIIHRKGHSWSSDSTTPIVMDTILKYSIAKEAPILEIGCGEGRDAFALLKAGYNLLASDISIEAISYCKRLRPEYSSHFAVLDCINGFHESSYDFIYSIAVIHMLVEKDDRDAFYRFISEHLNGSGIALICSMGDGISESASDISKAFDIVERNHESGLVNVPSTSLRMISLPSFEKELELNDLCIIEEGITESLPDFNTLLYAVVKKH
ncbi:MAG: class I SAM-dependent methyltransferase [Erysipelotrichaceae bacterium]|nr:class I SAM-dependent methyltransferase [Erysipelotrichaceae bacterium]